MGLTDLIQRRKQPVLNKIESENNEMYSNCLGVTVKAAADH